MFGPDIKPTDDGIEGFSAYMAARPLIHLVDNGRPGECAARLLTDRQRAGVIAAFRATAYPAIGRRHGRPMLYHFALDQAGGRVREILLEEVRDLEHCLGMINEIAGFWKLASVRVQLPHCARPDESRLGELSRLRIS